MQHLPQRLSNGPELVNGRAGTGTDICLPLSLVHALVQPWKLCSCLSSCILNLGFSEMLRGVGFLGMVYNPSVLPTLAAGPFQESTVPDMSSL